MLPVCVFVHTQTGYIYIYIYISVCMEAGLEIRE
jgi:hypothetical protein